MSFTEGSPGTMDQGNFGFHQPSDSLQPFPSPGPIPTNVFSSSTYPHAATGGEHSLHGFNDPVTFPLDQPLDMMYPMNTLDDFHTLDAAQSLTALRGAGTAHVGGDTFLNSNNVARVGSKWTSSIETCVKELQTEVKRLANKNQSQQALYNEVATLKSRLAALQSHQNRHSEAFHRNCTGMQEKHNELQRRQSERHVQFEKLVQRVAMVDRNVKTIDSRHEKMAHLVNAHENENAEIIERLQEFQRHITGALGEISDFIRNRYPDAPAFNDVQALLDLECEESED